MVDSFSGKKRSEIMSKIRSKNNRPEIILKRILKGTYLRQHPDIFGKPDFGIKSKKIAAFIDGCFWHKCPKHYRQPKSNRKYWLPKIKRNVQRAKDVNKTLKKEGYRVIRVWEHDIKKSPETVLKRIQKVL